MFRDKNINVNINSNITEHRAATDESVALLNEFQEKARENLICSVNINQDFLHAYALFFQDDLASDEFIIYCKFSLNGKEFKIKKIIEHNEFMNLRSESCFKESAVETAFKIIGEKLSVEIAKEITINNISILNKFFKFK